MSQEIFVRFADPISVAGMVPLLLNAFSDATDLIQRLRIADADGELWIKVELNETSELDRLRRLPAIVYRNDGDKLVRHGDRVPERSLGSLRDVAWRSLEETTEIALPTPRVAQPITADLRRSLKLVRSDQVARPDGMLARVDGLKAWCENTSQTRLKCLRWVVGMNDRRCLILGNPLPPITGTYFVADQCMLVPGGWTWAPKVSSRTLREVFDVPPNHWLLWESPLSHSLIPEQALAVMTRASVRTT